MIIGKMIFYFFLSISTILAFLGWYHINSIIGEITVIFIAITWVFIKNKLPTICCLLTLSISVTGVLLKGNSLLFILSAEFAFLTWDFALLESSLRKNSSTKNATAFYFIRLRSLSLSLAIGIIIYFMSGFFKLQLSFFVVAVVVILSFICLNRIIFILKGK